MGPGFKLVLGLWVRVKVMISSRVGGRVTEMISLLHNAQKWQPEKIIVFYLNRGCYNSIRDHH